MRGNLCLLNSILLALGSLFGAASMAGCAVETSELPDPLGAGKADVTDQVNLIGSIRFGETREGEFVDDLQYDAYSFSANGDSIVSAAITHAGSSASLDDFLLLYGPGTAGQGYRDAERLTSDDDSGWGRHGRIQDFPVPETGSYLIVIGTRDGLGRGRYRLELGCESGDCALEAPDPNGCDPRVNGYAELCMEAAIYDDGDSPEQAFDRCADEDNLLEQLLDRCESATPSAYCELGEDQLRDQMIPDCRQSIGMDYGLTVGPLKMGSAPEFADFVAGVDAAEAFVLFESDFEGSSGPRSIRTSAVPSSLETTLSANAGPADLLDENAEWAEHLVDEWGEERELEWYIGRVVEVWRDSAVIGYVAMNEAVVSYWDASDPEDPFNVSFQAWEFVNVDGEHVGTRLGSF